MLEYRSGALQVLRVPVITIIISIISSCTKAKKMVWCFSTSLQRLPRNSGHRLDVAVVALRWVYVATSDNNNALTTEPDVKQFVKIYLQLWIITSTHVEIRLSSCCNQIQLNSGSVVAGIQRVNKPFEHCNVVGIDSVFTLKRRNELKVDARRPHYVHLQPTQTAWLDQDDYVLSSCYSHSLTAHHTSQPQCMPSQFSSAAQLAARLDDHDMQGASSCRHSLEFSWQKFWPAVSSLIVDTTVHVLH